MVLGRGDDYPIHQMPEPVAYAGTDRNFYDRYFFNGYAPDGTGFFAIALGVLSLCGAVTGLVVSVALTVLLPNELRGLCIGAFIAVAGLIGFGLAPWIVTRVSAFMGGETMLAEALAIVGVSVSTLSFLAFIMAMRRVPEPVR